MNAVLGLTGVNIRRKSQHDLSFPIIILAACDIGMQKLVYDNPHLVSELYVYVVYPLVAKSLFLLFYYKGHYLFLQTGTWSGILFRYVLRSH